MRDKIGIIYSPGFGAGWSTWGDRNSALDQELAKAIEAKKPKDEIEAIAERNWPNQYQGGLSDAVVRWVCAGTAFRVDEYDGSESLTFHEDMLVAQ